MESSVGLLLIIFSFACALGSGAVAEKKGYSEIAVVAWFMAGLLFSFLGLFAVLLAPYREKGLLESGSMKLCPFCKELIRPNAIVCKHCGKELHDKSE